MIVAHARGGDRPKAQVQAARECKRRRKRSQSPGPTCACACACAFRSQRTLIAPRAVRSLVFRTLFLALVLFAPLAHAQETLASLEEPHRATGGDVLGRIWNVTVLPEEEGQRVLVFRNPPRSGFTLEVYDAAGTIVYDQTGTRGTQAFPALTPGDYRFRVDKAGEFQVTEKILSRTAPENVSAQLAGTDAYLFMPVVAHLIRFGGAVEVEWWDLTGAAERIVSPFERVAPGQHIFVLTVRGEEGAPYSIGFEATEAPPEPDADATPLAAWGALGALGALALARRRRGIHK